MEEDNFESYTVEKEFEKVFWSGQDSSGGMADDSEVRQWLRSLLDDKDLEQYKDVVFLCGPDGHERMVKAHRLILTTKSRSFADLLASQPDPSEPVRVTEVEPEVFETIIHYIYTGQIATPQRVVQTVDLLYAASKYDIASLCQLVKHFLETRLTHLNTKHFIMITQRVLDLHMDDLTTLCFTLIEQRTALVIQEPIFLRVSSEFISRLLQLNSFAGVSENQVFTRVLEWAVMRAGSKADDVSQEERPNESEFHLTRPHVRLVLEPFIRDFRLVSVTKDDLAALVKNSGVFTEREQLIVSYYLLDQTKDLGEFTMKERNLTTGEEKIHRSLEPPQKAPRDTKNGPSKPSPKGPPPVPNARTAHVVHHMEQKIVPSPEMAKVVRETPATTSIPTQSSTDPHPVPVSLKTPQDLEYHNTVDNMQVIKTNSAENQPNIMEKFLMKFNDKGKSEVKDGKGKKRKDKKAQSKQRDGMALARTPSANSHSVTYSPPSSNYSSAPGSPTSLRAVDDSSNLDTQHGVVKRQKSSKSVSERPKSTLVDGPNSLVASESNSSLGKKGGARTGFGSMFNMGRNKKWSPEHTRSTRDLDKPEPPPRVKSVSNLNEVKPKRDLVAEI